MREKIDKQEETIEAWQKRAESAEKALSEANIQLRGYFAQAQWWSKYTDDPDVKISRLAMKVDRQRLAIRKLHERLGDLQCLPGSDKPKVVSVWTITEDGFEAAIKDRPPRRIRLRLSTGPDGRPYILREDPW
jgi:hypothetical protein